MASQVGKICLANFPGIPVVHRGFTKPPPPSKGPDGPRGGLAGKRDALPARRARQVGGHVSQVLAG